MDGQSRIHVRRNRRQTSRECRRIAAQAPLAVKATRKAVLAGLEEGRQAGIDILLPSARALMDSEDAKEGMLSFVERREAKFTGK